MEGALNEATESAGAREDELHGMLEEAQSAMRQVEKALVEATETASTREGELCSMLEEVRSRLASEEAERQRVALHCEELQTELLRRFDRMFLRVLYRMNHRVLRAQQVTTRPAVIREDRARR